MPGQPPRYPPIRDIDSREQRFVLAEMVLAYNAWVEQEVPGVRRELRESRDSHRRSAEAFETLKKSNDVLAETCGNAIAALGQAEKKMTETLEAISRWGGGGGFSGGVGGSGGGHGVAGGGGHGLPPPPPYDRRHPMPSLAEYEPQETPTGRFTISPEMWQALQARVGHAENENNDLRSQLALTKARAEGYAQAVSDREKRSASFRGWLALAFTAITLLAGGAAYLFGHAQATAQAPAVHQGP